jgi:hypothetical protein
MLARVASALLSLSSIEPSSPPPPADATVAKPATVETIVIDARGELPVDLREEVQLRLGRRSIEWVHAGMTAPTGSSIWVVIEAGALQFIVSDGRAYRRSIESTEADAARAIASTIANTVAAIEAGRVEPEATGVPLPTPPAKETTQTKPEPAPPETPPPPAKTIAPPPPPQPLAWIGIGLGGVAAFGVGPPSDVQGFVGGGGLGLFRFLHRTGATAALQVRGLAMPRDGVLLSRLRISASGGWVWRPNRFDLVTEAGVTVEPIWIASSFELAPPTGAARSPAPLVGGRLAVSPGYTVWSRDRTALRLGLELDLAESVEARSPTGAVQILRGPTPFMRAGGFEIAIAIALELRFIAAFADP